MPTTRNEFRLYQIDLGDQVLFTVTQGGQILLCTGDWYQARRAFANGQGLRSAAVLGPTHWLEDDRADAWECEESLVW